MKKKNIHLLLVEDNEDHAALVSRVFDSSKPPILLSIAESLREARSLLAKSTPDIAIVDHRLPDGRGVELLTGSMNEFPYPLIIMTGHGDERLAVEAMKAGAFDYVVKSDESIANLPDTCKRVLREWHLILANKQGEAQLKESEARFHKIFDCSTDAIFLMDPEQDKIVEVNPWACQMLEFSREDLLAKPLSDIYPGQMQDLGKLIQTVFNEGMGRRE